MFIPSLYFSKDCTALHRLVHCTATFDEYTIVFVQPVPSTSVHKYNIVFVQREATFMQIYGAATQVAGRQVAMQARGLTSVVVELVMLNHQLKEQVHHHRIWQQYTWYNRFHSTVNIGSTQYCIALNCRKSCWLVKNNQSTRYS